jgi:hypothetical protein
MKDKLAIFLLGMFVAWTGMPALLHAMYIGLIAVAFGAGYLVHVH